MPPLALQILSGVRNILLHTIKSHREASPQRPLGKERKGIDFQWKKKIPSIAKFKHPRWRNEITWEVTWAEGGAQEMLVAL